MMRGRPWSTAATREKVVPRSIPTMLVISTPSRPAIERGARPIAPATGNDDLRMAQHAVAQAVPAPLLGHHGTVGDAAGAGDGYGEVPVGIEGLAEGRDGPHVFTREHGQQP